MTEGCSKQPHDQIGEDHGYHPKNPTSCFSKQNYPATFRHGIYTVRRGHPYTPFAPLLKDKSGISKACKSKRTRVETSRFEVQILRFSLQYPSLRRKFRFQSPR